MICISTLSVFCAPSSGYSVGKRDLDQYSQSYFMATLSKKIEAREKDYVVHYGRIYRPRVNRLQNIFYFSDHDFIYVRDFSKLHSLLDLIRLEKIKYYRTFVTFLKNHPLLEKNELFLEAETRLCIFMNLNEILNLYFSVFNPKLMHLNLFFLESLTITDKKEHGMDNDTLVELHSGIHRLEEIAYGPKNDPVAVAFRDLLKTHMMSSENFRATLYEEIYSEKNNGDYLKELILYSRSMDKEESFICLARLYLIQKNQLLYYNRMEFVKIESKARKHADTNQKTAKKNKRWIEVVEKEIDSISEVEIDENYRNAILKILVTYVKTCNILGYCAQETSYVTILNSCVQLATLVLNEDKYSSEYEYVSIIFSDLMKPISWLNSLKVKDCVCSKQKLHAVLIEVLKRNIPDYICDCSAAEIPKVCGIDGSARICCQN